MANLYPDIIQRYKEMSFHTTNYTWEKKEQVHIAKSNKPVGEPVSIASNCLTLSGKADLHVLWLKCVASSAIEDGEVSGDWAGSFIPLAGCRRAGKAVHASRGEKESPVLASCPVS